MVILNNQKKRTLTMTNVFFLEADAGLVTGLIQWLLIMLFGIWSRSWLSSLSSPLFGSKKSLKLVMKNTKTTLLLTIAYTHYGILVLQYLPETHVLLFFWAQWLHSWLLKLGFMMLARKKKRIRFSCIRLLRFVSLKLSSF